MIPENKWKWYGYPLHFCSASKCKWHMGTLVGKYVISSVGDMRLSDKSDMEEIGYKRMYETQVFKKKGKRDCGCPDIDLTELECLGSNDHTEAEKNHLAMCKKYAEIQYS